MNKNIIIIHPFLKDSGGSERITLEEEKYLRQLGANPIIATFDYNPDLFSRSYSPNYSLIDMKTKNTNFFSKILQRIITLRKLIKEVDPIIISVCNAEGCVYAYFATAFMNQNYFTQLPSSGYDNFSDLGKTLFSYALCSRFFYSGYHAIRNSTKDHKANLPETIPKLGLQKRLFSDIMGFVTRNAVRKAVNIFVLSNQVKWEIKQLYGKDANVLKGAYPKSLLNYKPTRNLKNDLGICGKKILFTLSRLVPKKRVDWIIKAFSILLSEGMRGIVLIIGGSGPSLDDLKVFAEELNISDSVIFTEFISEEQLYDYYYYSDVFVTADYADYDITAYVAIGFNKNIVWPIDHEMDHELRRSKKVFSADLSPESFAKAIKVALNSHSQYPKYLFDLYSWERYFENIYSQMLGRS